MNPIKKELVDEIRKEEHPIIIFGAGIVGKVLYNFCHEQGIEIECFCDNNIAKTQAQLFGKEIILPEKLKERYSEAILLISVADIKDVVEQIHDLNYSKWYSGGQLIKNYDLKEESTDFAEYAVGTCILCHDNYLNQDSLFLRSVDIIITERCSLKCKECSNLAQYYQSPKNCELNKLMESINAFFKVVDEVNEFRIIGGEPFMNKEWHLVVKRLIDEPKVKRIIIYTNGTIVPDESHVVNLINKKVLIFITDYGRLSKNISNLKQLFDRNNIAYHINEAGGWTSCSSIEKHNRDFQQQKQIFKDCCAKNLVTLSNGKLYRCPFAANADRLLAVPNYKEDYIDLFDKSMENINERKNQIRNYFLHNEFLQVCDYCAGRSLSDPKIKPAVQIDEPLKYKKMQ